MANTIFEKDEIISFTDNGREYRFKAIKDGEEGSGSVYGPAYDEINHCKVFLKKYTDPAPRCSWFADFVAYQHKIYEKIGNSEHAKNMIAGQKGYFQEPRGRFWQIIEFIDNSRDLKQYLEAPDTTWEQRKTFAAVFMYAMKVLHEEVGLVHGDLKPQNLLLVPAGQNYVIKLIDFDRPLLLDEGKIPWEEEGFLGSPGYYSPEHLRHIRPDTKSDVFTCGIILYEMLTGRHPYNGEYNTIQDLEALTVPAIPLLGSYGNAKQDQKISEMLQSMLDLDPSKRPTAAEVHECLTAVVVGGRRAPGKKTQLPIVQEMPFSAKRPGAADVVLLIDSTGSMGECIEAIKNKIHDFIHILATGTQEVLPVEDCRLRVVGYRDFTDCCANDTIAKKYRKFGGGGWFLDHPFTRNVEEMFHQLDSLKALGGGPPQESLLDALSLVMRAPVLPRGQENAENADQGHFWRSGGVGKVIVVFTDAGFHDEMSYSSAATKFDEGARYDFDLSGGNLDDVENAIHASHCKIYLFGPNIAQYEEFGELSKVVLLPSDENSGEGLVRSISDPGKFSSIIENIVKGISRSASECVDIPL